MHIVEYRFRMKTTVAAAFALAVTAVSCNWNASTRYAPGRMPLVEIDGDVLYEDELQQALPLGLSPADSADFADRYIRNWVQDAMFYQNAARNIPDTRDIDRLVENYRRSLIEHEYQRRIIAQKFSAEISDSQIEQFYNDNLHLFELDEPLIRGLYLKLSVRSHDIAKIRRLYTETDDESFEEIEKFCVRNAARQEFFYDKWRSTAEIEVLLPPMEKPLEELLKTDSCFEFRDDEYIYLLNVSEYAPKGGIEPLEHARGRIVGLLVNSNEVNYIRRIKEELYESAIDNNRLIFHKERK